jgi:hypothetical protein
VPLYAPRYFTSEYCLKEWAAFAARARSHGPEDPISSEAVVPALWNPVHQEKLPRFARSIQFTHANMGVRYATEGLYWITRDSRYRYEYHTAVRALAKRIVEVGEKSNLPTGEPLDLGDITL